MAAAAAAPLRIRVSLRSHFAEDHMATVAGPYIERRTGERRRSLYGAATAPFTLLRATDGMRVSWGGIWGGVLVAMGMLLLLTALGLAVGITAVDPGDTEMSTLGTGAGIWGAASLLVSLFVGGMVATRVGAIFDRTTGFFEGMLVWVVAVLLMAYMAGSGIGLLASGAFNLVGGAGKAMSDVVQQSGGVSGVDVRGMTSQGVDQMLAKLRDPQTAQQLSSATGLSQQDVSSDLQDMAQRVEASRDDPSRAASEVRRGVSDMMAQARAEGRLEQKAEEMQPKASAAAWITFGALVLSLLASVIGAMAGRRKPEDLPATPATTR